MYQGIMMDDANKILDQLHSEIMNELDRLGYYTTHGYTDSKSAIGILCGDVYITIYRQTITYPDETVYQGDAYITHSEFPEHGTKISCTDPQYLEKILEEVIRMKKSYADQNP